MRAGPRVSAAAVGVMMLGAAWGAGSAGQTTGAKNPPLVISSMSGAIRLFDFYCASCHGRDGKGHGPTAPALKTPPPDLTTIARSLGGSVPTARVEALIADGGTLLTPAHGSKDMPVWGPIFRALDARDALATIRISNVVAYLESMQAK
jgi:mono/diheme cytochrome c family protein